jgi:hypothetical protein
MRCVDIVEDSADDQRTIGIQLRLQPETRRKPLQGHRGGGMGAPQSLAAGPEFGLPYGSLGAGFGCGRPTLDVGFPSPVVGSGAFVGAGSFAPGFELGL